MRRLVVSVALLAGCDDIFHLRHVPDVDGRGPADVEPADVALAGPEALYNFEELSAGLLDVTGHHHDGTCAQGTCPTTTIGQHGSAGQFDGNSEVDIPSFSMTAFTVSVAMRIDATEITMCPVNRLFGAIGADSWQVCVTQHQGRDTASLAFYTTDAPDLVPPDVVMTLGTWHHFAIRWDGAIKSLFYDGAEVLSAPGTTQFDGQPILVGRDYDAPSPVAAVIGALDDIAIYNRALSNAEISALAQ